MSKKSDDGGLGCLFTLIFLPFVLIFAIIKDLCVLGAKAVKKSANTSKHRNTKNNKDNEYWETHCEFCGELLEDCECDNKHQSKQDISQDDMDDLEFDEMNDIWDEMDE